MARSRKMKLAHIEECFERLAAVLPDPKTELDYRDPYTLLVAVVLSAQATDVGVNRATKGLYAAANTPLAMVDLGVDGIAHHIRTIGLFNTKAKNVHRLSEILIETHDGIVPASRGWQENCECGAERGLRASDHCCRYAYIPGWQPHRHGAGQDT